MNSMFLNTGYRAKPHRPEELAVVHKQGYIALIGQWVERIAATAICNIPDHAISNRKIRDGDAFHITISKAKETTSRMRQSSSLQQMNQLISNSPPPINLGVGMVKHENNSSRSWYCSISWAAGQQLRTMFELPPRDFHLTLGFDHKDVHVHKGPSTLLIHSCITTTQILSKEQIEGLRDAALIEAHTSQERSLISFALALAQAELIADPALVLSIKHSINGLKHMATVASSVHNSSSSSQ